MSNFLIKTDLRACDTAEDCPRCGEPLSFDEVDIGVGVQRGNYRCDFCGWSERDELDKLTGGVNEGE